MAVKTPLAASLLDRTETWTSRSRKGSARWYYAMPAAMFQMLAVAITIAVMPSVKLSYFDHDSGKTTRVNTTSEVLRATFMIVVSGKFGSVSDMIGRRPFLMLASVANLIPLLFLLATRNVLLYLLVWSLMGWIGGDNQSALNAYIADCSKECDRSRRFGLVGAAVGIMFAIGPVCGALLEARTSTQTVLMVASGAAALQALVTLPLPESLPADRRLQPQVKNVFEVLQPMKEFFDKANGRMWFLVGARVARSCVQEGYMTVTLFACRELIPTWTNTDNGLLLLFVGGGMIIGQGVLLPCFVHWRCSDNCLAKVAQCVSTLAAVSQVILLSMSPSPTPFFVLAFATGCSAFFVPVSTKLVTSGVDAELGLILGVLQSLDQFTAVSAPVLFTAAFAIGAWWTFVLIAIGNVLGLICILLASSMDEHVLLEDPCLPIEEEFCTSVAMYDNGGGQISC